MLEQQLEQDDESQCCRNTKIHQGLKKTPAPCPSRQHLHDTRASHHTRPNLTYTAMHCDTNRNRKQARKKKSIKRKNQSCAKRDLEFRDLSCTLSCLCLCVHLSLSLSLYLSRSLSVRVCLKQNLHLRSTTNPLAKMGFRVCEPCPRFVLVQGQLHMSVE
jgi:hypothetical protein